jgi:O-antigen/teichoic acid export membrane protein
MGRLARDSLIVVIGGQLERAAGIVTALALRWGLDPGKLGVYTGLRLFLDNTNRSSLGIGLGAIQEIPILRASGREAEANRIASVAHTASTLTCIAYTLCLLAWAAWQWHAPGGRASPMSAEWTGGFVVIAFLALLKRYETLHVAILRAHQEFAFTTRVDLLEAIVSGAAVVAGIMALGFWGLLVAVTFILLFKIILIKKYSNLQFEWIIDLPLTWRLMRTGLPILANTTALSCILTVDRALIFGVLPDAERAVGLYSVALLGTSWCLDLAGRAVLVLYPYFQTTYGRTENARAVARHAARATEIQAVALSTLAACAFLIGPGVLGKLLPRYAEGLPALRPLLPGTLLLALAWPSRQLLVAIARPWILLIATLAGLLVTFVSAYIGVHSRGLFGIALGMSIGHTVVFLLTSAAAIVPQLGIRVWLAHLRRLAATLAWAAAAVVLAIAATARISPALQPLAQLAIAAMVLLPFCGLAARRVRPGYGFRNLDFVSRGSKRP